MIPEGGGDKWVPPPWHAPAPRVGDRAHVSPAKTTIPVSPQKLRAGTGDTGRQVVLSLAFAPGATGVLALMMAFLGLLSGPGAVPVGLVLLCAVQVGGYVVARRADAAAMARSWLISFAASGGLLPLLSLQVSNLHEPYVSIERRSATPAMVAAIVVILFLAVLAFWCGTSSWAMPEVAAITFLPAALLVPAVLGIQGTATQRTALQTLAEASLFAAGGIVLAWSLPRGARLLVPPAAFAIQTLALWLAGYGPSFPESSGRIVTTLYAVTLILTGALVLALPFYAAWLKHAVEHAEEMGRPRRRSTDGDVSRA